MNAAPAALVAALALAIAESDVLSDAAAVSLHADLCTGTHPDFDDAHVHVAVNLKWSDSPAACAMGTALPVAAIEDAESLGAIVGQMLDAAAAGRERIILSERAPDYPPADLDTRGDQ